MLEDRSNGRKYTWLYELGTEFSAQTNLSPGTYRAYFERTSDGEIKELNDAVIPDGQYIYHTLYYVSSDYADMSGEAYITEPDGLYESVFQTSMYDFTPDMTPLQVEHYPQGYSWQNRKFTNLTPDTYYTAGVQYNGVWYPTLEFKTLPGYSPLMTKSELLKYATDNNIDGINSKLKKDEILAKLDELQGE